MQIKCDFSELIEFAKRLENSDLDKTFKRITKDISKALLKRMKSFTPVDEYDLINGWDGNKFAVTEKKGRYEVLIVNTTPYATAVNDGHMVFNQYGGAHPVKRRIQVRSPHRWQTGNDTYYVFGHFFVERGIVQLENTSEIEQIVMRELQKWWDSV